MATYTVAGFLAFLSAVSSRETFRSMPTISNSLVNLGKMEISFYLNGNDRDSSIHRPIPIQSNSPFFLPKTESTSDESCPCSNLRNSKNPFLSNPSALLNKILTNNNLFSFHNEPVTSTFCCESHENIQENNIVFEFPVNSKNLNTLTSRSNVVSAQSNTIPMTNNAMPMMPFLFNSIIPNKSILSPLKTKSIEIFLFPKKKEVGSEVKGLSPKTKDLISKDNIQIVGDKELKNNISLFKPVLPVVKKDLNLQEKNEKQREQWEKEKADIGKEANQFVKEPAGKPNTI